MGLSLWGSLTLHTIVLFVLLFSSVIYFISYFIPLAPSSLTVCEGPSSMLGLPAYVSGPQAPQFLEGNQIGLAGQVPRVNPDTPGRGYRSGED